ncbi:hypothetical protein [Pseudooceanicola aestuarii]|uniref:hypothetical protein n=1 Tax=Pseudooceanicola aestuarii TaxID=2697319 RepID=UPI001EF8861B|nr:hypothetical protein [Pseudooceanicola aestuarii]
MPELATVMALPAQVRPPLNVLIVESEPDLGTLWQHYLSRSGCKTSLVHEEDAAIACLQSMTFQVIVMNLVLETGAALAIADFASYRQPGARIIFVTDTSFFSDGSIFSFAPNACALMRSDMAPDDLVAVVEYHGSAARPG